MKKIIVKDKNGKEFNTADLEKIKIEPLSDEEGNYSISNISDAKGKTLNIAELKDSEDDLPKSIIIDVEATHAGKNLNYAIYPDYSLANDHKTYLKDFAKPLLKNHDTHSEPLGRVVETDFSDSQISAGKKAVKLKIKVSDSDAIKKFIDGRYKTFSIGASADTITCDICKTKIVKDGVIDFCGHWRGQSYELAVDGSEETTTKTAYWTFEDMYFSEISVVNKPADRDAQLTGITVEDGKVDGLEDGQYSKEALLKLINDADDDEELFASIMDNLDIKDNAEEEPEEDDSTSDDNSDVDNDSDDATGDDSDSDDETDDDPEEEPEDEKTVESLKDEIEVLENSNQELQDKVKELEDEVKALEKSLEDKEKELDEATSDNKVLEKENEVVLDKMSLFARKLKNQLENRLMDLKLVTHESDVTDDEKGRFKNEIKDMSIKEMSAQIDDLKRKVKPRHLKDNTLGENSGKNVETIMTKDEKETLGDYIQDLAN